jgi:hypothetical protein
MRIASSLRVALLATATGMIIVSVAGAQTLSNTISTTSGVTLKTFTPVDSFYLNSTATSYSIALVHTVSGSPTEYRVSRFSDFRDANWIPYVTRPTTTIQRSVFPPVTNGGTQITLYLQVRAKNPKAGQPISLIGGKVTVQPDFFFSDPLGRRIRLVYAG